MRCEQTALPRRSPPLRSPSSQRRRLAAGRGCVGPLTSQRLSCNFNLRPLRGSGCASQRSHSGSRWHWQAVLIRADAHDRLVVGASHGSLGAMDARGSPGGGFPTVRRQPDRDQAGHWHGPVCAPHFGLWDRQPLAQWPRPRLRSAGRRSEKSPSPTAAVSRGAVVSKCNSEIAC
jgi:hypothetical protein